IACNANGCDTTRTQVIVHPKPQLITTKQIQLCSGTKTTLKVQGGERYEWREMPNTTVISTADSLPILPTKNTLYTVRSITKFGCITEETITVTLGTIKAIAHDTTVCKNTTVTLQVSGGSEYDWFDEQTGEQTQGDNKTIQAITNKRYMVIAKSGTCRDTTHVAVTVQDIPILQSNDTVVCSGSTVHLYVKTPQANTQYTWLTEQGNPVQTGSTYTTQPTQTIHYIIKAINQYGCVGYDTSTVTVNNALAIIASADTSICAGSAANLIVNNPEQTINYTWSDEQNYVIGNTASITVQPTQTTMYSVKGLRNGCDGVDTVRVVVHALPSVSVRDTSICQGQTATVKVVNPDATNTYTWKDDKGNVVAQSTEYTSTPQTTSTYSVTVRSSEGCESSALSTITIEPKTSVRLFVAPIRDSINVEDTVRVQIFAQANREVQLQQLAYDLQTETDVLDIPTSVRSGQWQQVHVTQAVTLNATPTQVYEFTGKALVTQTRKATISILKLATDLNPECSIQEAIGRDYATGIVCANPLLNIQISGILLLVSPNPSTGEVTVTSDYDIEEMQIVDALGQMVTSPTSSPKERTSESSSPSPLERAGVRSRSGAMPRVEHKVQIEANGLYFIRAKVNGVWITRIVVVQT
ncbi:MAG: hypothetical protein JNJ85_05460, partial [Candidatus Kapabacteria bacterium]|nr:hypothetical protein [Candidatus Kapabacteria bacterium]